MSGVSRSGRFYRPGVFRDCGELSGFVAVMVLGRNRCVCGADDFGSMRSVSSSPCGTLWSWCVLGESGGRPMWSSRYRRSISASVDGRVRYVSTNMSRCVRRSRYSIGVEAPSFVRIAIRPRSRTQPRDDQYLRRDAITRRPTLATRKTARSPTLATRTTARDD